MLDITYHDPIFYESICEEKVKMERRVPYYDYLRFYATCAVIFLHVSCQNWSDVNVFSYEWRVFNFFDSLVRWCVPIFIMISGALFLNRVISIKMLYTKYIFRIVMAYLFWAFVYALVEYQNIKNFLLDIIEGESHLWFLFMIVGIYIAYPIFGQIIKNEKIMKYYLLIAFISNLFIPEIILFIEDFFGSNIPFLLETIKKSLMNTNMQLFMGYGFYFVLGFYLDKQELSKRNRTVIYVLGLIGMLLTFSLENMYSNKYGFPTVNYYNYLSINVCFEAMAVFTIVKQIYSGKKKEDRIIKIFAKYSFGIYLVHMLILYFLAKNEINTLLINPLLSVPFISTLVFLLSFVISIIMNHLPILKKYIV